MRRRRTAAAPPWASQLCYRLAFIAGNIAVIAVLYSVPGILVEFEETPADTAAETWLWIGVISSCVTYFMLQGSEPGYVAARATDATARGDVNGAASDGATAIAVTRPDSVPPVEARIDSLDSIAVGVGAGGHASETSADTGAPHPSDHDARISALLAEHETAAAQAVACMRPCTRCGSAQPPRSHHCSSCDKCVATFDHHCSVIGTCIGERNRARFWLFLLTEALALGVAIGVLRTSFVWRRSYREWVSTNILPLLTLIVLAALQAAVCGLLGFHSWLAITNTTTFETVTGARRLWYLAGTNPKDCDLPYSNGALGNLRLFFCELEVWPWRGGCCSRGAGTPWVPKAWQYPGIIDRNSDDVIHNIWENRYYSCCG